MRAQVFSAPERSPNSSVMARRPSTAQQVLYHLFDRRFSVHARILQKPDASVKQILNFLVLPQIETLVLLPKN